MSVAVVVFAIAKEILVVLVVALGNTGARVILRVPPAVAEMVGIGGVPRVDTLGGWVVLLGVPVG